MSRDTGRADASDALDAYLARLDAALARVPAAERRDILLETRSHVLERIGRPASPGVDEVLAELGPPAQYARRFLPAAPPRRQTGTLFDIARLATGGVRSLPLLLLVLAAYAVAMLMLVIVLWKVAAPTDVGLWIDGTGVRRTFFFGTSDTHPAGREVLGYWLAVIAFAVAAAIHLTMSALLRRVLRAAPPEGPTS